MPPGEVSTTASRIEEGDRDGWYREWIATADRIAAVGEESASAGHAVSARDAYLRASSYYRTAYLPLYGSPVDPRLVEAFDKETTVFQKAAALMRSPVEPVEIPYEGATLPGYFCQPDDSGRPPAYARLHQRLRLDDQRDVPHLRYRAPPRLQPAALRRSRPRPATDRAGPRVPARLGECG